MKTSQGDEKKMAGKEMEEVYLKEAAPDNWRVDIGVSEDQRHYVSDLYKTLVRAYDFSQFFIDARYQGRGYGRAACKLVLDEMRRDGRFRKVVLCYIEGNYAAEKMYRSFGFQPTGEVDEDEICMSLEW